MPKVVCVRSLVPKEKNSAVCGDLAGPERRARQFDHGADLIFDLALGLGGDRFRHGVDALLDEIEFGLAGDERHHDFRHDRRAGRAAGLDRGLEDGARLHLRDFRIGDRQPAAAEAEHRIELVQLARAVGELFRIGAHGLRDFGDLVARCAAGTRAAADRAAGWSPAGRP